MKQGQNYSVDGKSNREDDRIKEINLKGGQYKESTLVDKICTEAQKRSYHKKEKFANNKQRSMFLDRLSCYCTYDYDQDRKMCKVKKVFTYPKTDAEVKVHSGIYQCLTPLILDMVLRSKSEGRHAVFSAFDLAENCSMFNANYKIMKHNQAAIETDLHIPQNTAQEFFLKSDDRINYYIRKCVEYLNKMGCVVFDEIHLIKRYTEEVIPDEETDDVIKIRRTEKHIASKEEMDLYTAILEEASKKAGIRKNADRWYGKTAFRYQTEVSRLFKKNHIAYVCRGFVVYRFDTDRCREILNTFSDKSMNQYRQGAGSLFKALMDERAEARFITHSSFDENYLEHFKDLSEIALLFDAPDIKPRLLSAENYEERMERLSKGMKVKLIEYSEGY